MASVENFKIPFGASSMVKQEDGLILLTWEQKFEMESCMRKTFPALNEFVFCPAESCAELDDNEDLFGLVQHLNDDHQWKREDIATWLEELDLDLRAML